MLFVVATAAGFVGLRALRVPRPVAALAVAALLSTPICIQQLGTPSTDIPALCWLICAAALAARSIEQPGLVAAAIVAAGLAIGTKTTPVPLALLVVALLVWRNRERLRVGRGLLVVSGLTALAVSAPWYVRNLIDHGSPLWPFKALPGGDAVPPAWSLLGPSFLQDPAASVSGRVTPYLEALEGGLLLLVGAALSGLLTRRRADIAASGVAVLAFLLWAAAPSTGQPETPIFNSNVVGTTRYMLPALAAATLAVALAASHRSKVSRVFVAVLTVALGMNLVRDAQLEARHLPDALWILIAVVAGAALAVAAFRVAPRASQRRWLPRAAFAALLLAIAAVLAAAAGGLIRRHVETAAIPGVNVARWAMAQPGFGGDQPIYFAGTVFGQLAGPDLRHRLVLLPPDEPCDVAAARAANGLLVVDGDYAAVGLRTPNRCSFHLRPVYQGGDTRVYGRLGD